MIVDSGLLFWAALYRSWKFTASGICSHQWRTHHGGRLWD